MRTDAQIIDEILDKEGGFVDHPFDRGGPTNFGITKYTLAAWRGADVTAEDVRALTEQEARTIYEELYINKPGLYRIADDKLRGFLVDTGVNHGPKKAIKMLQTALNITADGIIGPQTMKALLGADPQKVYLRACAARVRTYGRIIATTPSQAVFAAGWANRVAEFIEEA